MGADCGYLAVMSALASGAERAYINEEGVTLKDLQDDLQVLEKRFHRDHKYVCFVALLRPECVILQIGSDSDE